MPVREKSKMFCLGKSEENQREKGYHFIQKKGKKPNLFLPNFQKLARLVAHHATDCDLFIKLNGVAQYQNTADFQSSTHA